jgi:lysyl-tRNA synthetase, class II
MSTKEKAPEVQREEQISSEHEVRLAKIEEMKEHGMVPWPSFKPVSSTCSEAKESFVEEEECSDKIQIAGRLMSKREHGKTIFCNIQDRSGTLQIYIRKDALDEKIFENFKHFFDLGDIVWFDGTIFKTRMGEVTLKATDVSLLSKSLHPLPEKYHGLSDVEQRYRQRYLDLISNPESKEKFLRRSKIVQSIRNFLNEKDFIEVETPMLHPIPGGASARPFVTHHNAYDMDLYLRIAPELYLKRLVVGGLERVFEVNRNFRNEGVSTKHNPEFTMLEFYMAHGDYRDGMKLTEDLMQDAAMKACGSLKLPFEEQELDFTAPFKKLTIEESLCEIGGFTKEQVAENKIDETFKKHDLDMGRTHVSYGEKLFFLFEVFVEEKIVQPTFVIGYPIEVSPLAKRDENNSNVAARFELFAMGMELANGFTELNDPIDQADRFKQQVEARESGDAEAHHYDADYVRALEQGLPPAVGVGLGIDRVTMLLTNTRSIKDVILFPTMKKV